MYAYVCMFVCMYVCVEFIVLCITRCNQTAPTIHCILTSYVQYVHGRILENFRGKIISQIFLQP